MATAVRKYWLKREIRRLCAWFGGLRCVRFMTEITKSGGTARNEGAKNQMSDIGHA
jgi:hypothetical protein